MIVAQKTKGYFRAFVFWVECHVNPAVTAAGEFSQDDKQFKVEEFNVLCRSPEQCNHQPPCFTLSSPPSPTSSNGGVVRAARPGRSSSRQSRPVKNMFPVSLCVHLLQRQTDLWSSSMSSSLCKQWGQSWWVAYVKFFSPSFGTERTNLIG